MENVTASEVPQLQTEGKKVLVDFWATWCGPCRSLIPQLESLSGEYDNIQFVKVNVDENREFAMGMGIRSVPTVIFFNGEQEISRLIGVNPPERYREILNSL